MSLLSLSKRILNRDKQTASDKAGKKKAAKPASKKENADTASIIAGRIGLYPMMTEKSIRQQEQSTIVFRVRPSATKQQIMIAVREQYGVTPLNVRTARFRPKVRRRGVTSGSTNFWKKAYVTVDNIQAITTGP